MNIDEQAIREVCRQCIEKKKAFEFMLWCIEEFPSGWQNKLKKIFQEELRKMPNQPLEPTREGR